MLTGPLLAYRVCGCTMHHLTEVRAPPRTTTVYRVQGRRGIGPVAGD